MSCLRLTAYVVVDSLCQSISPIPLYPILNPWVLNFFLVNENNHNSQCSVLEWNGTGAVAVCIFHSVPRKHMLSRRWLKGNEWDFPWRVCHWTYDNSIFYNTRIQSLPLYSCLVNHEPYDSKGAAFKWEIMHRLFKAKQLSVITSV